MQFRFPDTFWWGSASSAPQAEGASLQGGKAPTIWDHWFAIEPNRFHQQVGPADTSTFYQHFRDDIALMQEIGHNSFRTSISWARLLPQGRGEPNPEAVRFYHAMLDELLARGITPFINLFHFDMPMSMQEQGGWESRKVVDAFAEFAATCFRLFGGKVKHWFTFNEPIVPVEGGYLYDFHYPNVVDFRRAATVAYHTMLAHAKAVQAYRAQGQDGQIGIILNLTPSYPRSQHPADLKAANIADLFFNRSFLDPAVKGEYPTELVALLREYDQLPASEPEDRALLAAGKVDLLGVNYYQPRRVKARSNEEKFLGEQGQIQDDYRIAFIRDHLSWVHKGIGEGCQCLGYHLWTFVDNWSWSNAYKNRYGFVRLDLATGERRIKKSGEWFADVSRNGGF